MSRRSWPWSVLKLDSTADSGAVRKAYADLLRAMNPDNDPAAFANLRSARDQALRLAKDRAAREQARAETAERGEPVEPEPAEDNFNDDDYDDEEFVEIGEHEGLDFMHPQSFRPEPAALDDSEVEPAPLPEAVEARYALENLLYTGDRTDPLVTAEARRLLDIILADPILERVSDRMDIEQSLANLVQYTLPRSAALVRPLADYFGWRAEAKTINQSGTIGHLADHALAQDFRERVERPDNKGYKAWRALTEPGAVAWYQRRPPYLKELMQVIREQHPLLERAYDGQKFDYWVGRSGKSEREGGSNWGWIIIGIVVILAAIANFTTPESESDREQQARVELAEFDDPLQRRRTIDDVLRAAGGEELNAYWLERHDSAFFAALDQRLLAQKAQATRLEDAEPILAQIVIDRVRAALADATQGQLVAYRFAQLGLLRHRLEVQRDNTRCADILQGAPRELHLFPSERAEPWRAVQRTLLLSSHAEATARPTRVNFNLLVTSIDDAARRAGMSGDEFRTAFAGEGNPADTCRANAAMLETALARPGDTDRLDVLRRL